jgi:hypothetical protein
MWTCPKCASKVDPSFEVCWNCGTSPDGVVDPTFVSADDSGPIEADPVIPSLNADQDVNVLGDLPDPIGGNLVEAYMALDLMEAKFLADQLNMAGIQAASDTHDLRHSFGPADAEPRVWVREEDLPGARAWLETYERNKVARLEE